MGCVAQKQQQKNNSREIVNRFYGDVLKIQRGNQNSIGKRSILSQTTENSESNCRQKKENEQEFPEVDEQIKNEYYLDMNDLYMVVQKAGKVKYLKRRKFKLEKIEKSTLAQKRVQNFLQE